MFIETSEFPFVGALEASWQAVRQELDGLARDRFVDWPEKYLYGRGWHVFGLFAFGRKLLRNCDLCPDTTRLVEAVPGLTTAGFSWMEPGTHIRPHVGYTDSVLRCHLGLIVPPGDCALRVAGEVRRWEEGRCFVFDDRSEHEAWNRAAADRVILLLDFAKPSANFSPPGFLASRLERHS